MNLDAHSRKWSLIIQGIVGAAGEDEHDTGAAVMKFGARDFQLNREVIEVTQFAACHRLSQTANAGIIIKFVDLTIRNVWLANAKNLYNRIPRATISSE